MPKTMKVAVGHKWDSSVKTCPPEGRLLKRSFRRLIVFLFLGAILGTLAGQLLVQQIPALAKHTTLEWHPQADLAVLRISIDLVLQVNWLTFVGIIISWFAERKLK